jgi:hypothetical protein
MSESLTRDFYEEALIWGKLNYPNSPEAHHQAFASIIAFACKTPVIRSQVKDTMRTYVAINMLLLKGQPGKFDFEEAIDYFAHNCYGPITQEHAAVYKQCRFRGDYPADVAAAQAILANSQPIPLSKQFLDRETD